MARMDEWKKARLEGAYQLKVTLLESDPMIWRRLRVPGTTTLKRLDRIIQEAMGWTNSHLHVFTAGGAPYSAPSSEWEVEMHDETRVRLADIAREEGEAFVYEYDLGDGWRHQVLVEEIVFQKDGFKDPLCTDGERACPPEDSGGLGGYYEKLEVLRNPTHEEHEDTRIWMESMAGVSPFDPEAFDVVAANRRIRSLSRRRG